MTDILLIGILAVVTRYDEPYIGRPLYCGGYYEVDAAPWFAVPISQLGQLYQCGDLIYAHGITRDGEPWSMLGRVRDVGPFGAHCVRAEDTCAPIVFDVGNAPFDELSARLDGWTNITERARWQRLQSPN